VVGTRAHAARGTSDLPDVVHDERVSGPSLTNVASRQRLAGPSSSRSSVPDAQQ
jgi:hypothetical protein